MENLNPKGVMVMVEAEHMCMSMRGIKKPGSKTVTFSALGEFKENSELRKMFFDSVKD
jgi:GTP cyclohydrolase I